MIQHTGGIDQQFVVLTRLSEDHLFATMGVEQSSIDASARREHGIRFKWTNAASPAADQTARSTPVSRAWRRVVAWLREVKAGRTHSLVQSATWRLLYYQHDLNVQDPYLVSDAGRFIAWQKLLTQSTLSCKPMVEAFLRVAVQSAEHADGRAAAIDAKRFADRLQDGPAELLKRQHLLSRAATGWTPSREGAEPETVINEYDEVDGISLEELKRTLQPNSNASTPLASQSSANAERADLGRAMGVALQA